MKCLKGSLKTFLLLFIYLSNIFYIDDVLENIYEKFKKRFKKFYIYKILEF